MWLSHCGNKWILSSQVECYQSFKQIECTCNVHGKWVSASKLIIKHIRTPWEIAHWEWFFFCQWSPKKTCTLSLGAYIVTWIAYFGEETWKLCFPKGRGSIGLENFLTKHLTFLWTNILLPRNEYSKFDKWTKTNPWKKWMHVKNMILLC